MNLTNAWKQHFLSLPGNEQGNRNMESFSLSMSSTQSIGVRLNSFAEDVDTVIFIADLNKKVAVIHSPKNHGGTRNRPTNKISCLIGLGPQAACVVLNESQAVSDCNIRTPTLDELEECTTKEDVKALDPPDNNTPVTFEGSASFIPAPWLTEYVINEESRDPTELIVGAMIAAKAFDLGHENDEAYENSKAKTHVEDFIMWLYGVFSGEVPETRFNICPDDGEVKNWCEERHAACIMGSLSTVQENTTANPDNSAILAQLTEIVANQAEETGAANKIRKEELQLKQDREDSKTDRLKKLHHSIKNMLMNAAAPYCVNEEEYVTSSILPDSCMNFFNCENAGTADQELAEQFRELGVPEANYSHGTVQSLLAGHFLYKSGLEPSNFTAFGFNEDVPVLSNEPNRTLLLYLAATQGRGKTLEEITRSTKQWVKAPMTFEELTMQFILLMAASTIFFSAESALVPSLNSFQKSMMLNKRCIKTRIASDELYAAKILYAVDTRVQRWLQECKIAKERENIDDSIVNFKDLTNDVLNGRFTMQLPLVFMINPATDQKIGGRPTSDGPPTKKSRMNGERGEDKRTLNKNQIEAFKIKPKENWRIFCGEVQKERPVWDGETRMCHRWFIKGYCFEDCYHKSSHVEKEKVPADKEKEFGTWMKKARSEK